MSSLQHPSLTRPMGFIVKPLLCIYLYISLFSVISISAVQFPKLPLGSFALNSTVGSFGQIFSNFSRIDINQGVVGAGGQHVYRFEIPRNKKMNVQISTCIGSDFDTHLVLFDENPFGLPTVTPIAEGANDISCDEDRSRGFISVQLTSNNYYILITGEGSQEGTYNLSLSASEQDQSQIPWGIDRIDQRNLPLNNEYAVQDSGEDVWIYLIDSGVRASHKDFDGRVTEGYDFINNEEGSAPDCTGHGTHVAGIILGKKGISRKARIVAIRAFDCENKATIANIVDAVGWTLLDSRRKARANVVVAMMFSISTIESPLLQSTMNSLINTGITTVVPAGNNDKDACNFYPGSLSPLLTVGATNSNDERSSFSNFGACVDVYAPGENILSTWHNSDTSYRNLSGSSQAAAHMVGVVSNFLDLNKELNSKLVTNAIVSMSTVEVVRNVESNETAKLGFVRSVPKFDGSVPPSGNVFLLMILSIQSFDCDQESSKGKTLREVFSSISDVRSRLITISCTSDQTTKTKQAGFEFVELQIQAAERYAGTTFALLQNAIGIDKENTEEKLDFTFSVVEQPWAVDSRRIVFWGSPSFLETESASLSRGAIIGISVGSLFIASLLGACGWICYRHVTKLDEIESMEGSADYEKGPVHFNDHADTNNDSMIKRSFRNVVRSMSMRRSANGRFTPSEEPPASRQHLSHMGSFIGGMGDQIGRDDVRMRSFGAEAFAELASLSRSNSVAGMVPSSEEKNNSSSGMGQRELSFRGANNAVIISSPKEFGETIPDMENKLPDESLRMRSIRGEALAVIQRIDHSTDDKSVSAVSTNI